jgi:predicted lipid-binding transport protein (Tim44 family)
MEDSMSYRPLVAVSAIFAALLLIVGDLQARPSGGTSIGSRGSRTLSAPPTTSTAPNTAAPIQRTVTQPAVPSTAAGQARPAANPGFFNRPGLIGGLFAGFLGAGLLGMLFGHGLFGGLGGIASVLGLLIQIAIVGGVGLLIWKWWQRRQGLATASGPAFRDSAAPASSYGAMGLSAALGSSSGNVAIGKVEIGKGDFDDFERLLSEVSLAYGDEDLARLRALVTPEMHSYFSEQVAGNVNRGVVNKISGLKLLQGDLAEAWREDDVEYASVAMRYAITDSTIERATGRAVEGTNAPAEVTELWTFLRMRGSGWMLSAIQQA